MIEIVELLLLGFAAGLLSAFFGVGGGIIMVPLLSMLKPELPLLFVIATSLSVIIFNALFNTFRFSRTVKFDLRSIGLVAVSVLFFTWVSSEFASGLNEETLHYIFAAALLIVTIWINYNPTPVAQTSQRRTIKSILIGFISGGISGLTGLGGGAFNVPLLHRWLALPFKETSAYSNLIMLVTATTATLTYVFKDAPEVGLFAIGYVVPKLTFAMLIGSFFGSKIGIRLHKKVAEKKLKLSFSILLILIIIRTLLSATGLV